MKITEKDKLAWVTRREKVADSLVEQAQRLVNFNANWKKDQGTRVIDKDTLHVISLAKLDLKKALAEQACLQDLREMLTRRKVTTCKVKGPLTVYRIRKAARDPNFGRSIMDGCDIH